MRFTNLLFVLSWLLTTALPQASAAGCFLKPVFYSAGGVAVAVGDVNNDGNLDLIITGGSSAKTIIIFLGNADGSFGTRNQYPLPQPGHKAVLGDFNRDGNLDIAVPVQDFRFHVPGMSVLLGNGDGTFQSAISYSVGESPMAAVVGDFNHDGKLDIAVAGTGAGGITLLLGHGDGTFAGQQLIPDPNSVLVGLATGDLNGDGNLDFVATSVENNIDVFVGNGDGTFQPVKKYAVGNGPGEVWVADMNRDGKLDATMVNWLGEEGDTGISVPLGNGDGTFGTTRVTSAGSGKRPISLAVADFGNDGVPDVLETSEIPSQLALYRGVGDGTFPKKAFFNVASSVYGVETGDFNHDGRADAVVTGGRTLVLLNSGQCH